MRTRAFKSCIPCPLLVMYHCRSESGFPNFNSCLSKKQISRMSIAPIVEREKPNGDSAPDYLLYVLAQTFERKGDTSYFFIHCVNMTH